MELLPGEKPYFSTNLGHAYLGDSLELLPKLPPQSIDLICTSPPFALLRQKAYGNVHSKEYVEWFMKFAKEFARVLKPDGSLVIDIGGTWVKGRPIRSVYHYELMLELIKAVEEGGCGFNLIQELYWYNPAKLPTPAEWVTVRRIRLKDAVNTVWWLSLSDFPKASNKRVLKRYSESQLKLMRDGYKPGLRPSEHDISDKFGRNNNGAIPPIIINAGLGRDDEIGDPVLMDIKAISSQVISASNTSSNDLYLRLCRENSIPPHPARFPRALPEFVINLCTEEGDIVLDPFAGSNMTGSVAEKLRRRWIALERSEEYLQGAALRFREPNEDGLSYLAEIKDNAHVALSQIMMEKTANGCPVPGILDSGKREKGTDEHGTEKAVHSRLQIQSGSGKLPEGYHH
ncbi:MAG: site-specific DNA-methyltransferase [Chloroflexota bacterium]|nr:site-specific DNA-methyltransferase [Chloroflexota bacterium]